LSKWDFLELLGKDGIPLHYGEEELKEDLEVAKNLQGKQRNSEAEEELLVVSNSSVIIALARMCRLGLLEKLFKKVIVPEAV